jgi:opacity protein-like surface antigen
MLKKVALLVGICACLSTPAMSADGPYFGLSAGVTSTVDSDLTEPGFSAEASFDTGLAVSGALGYKTGMGRIEAEIGYKSADANNISAYGYSQALSDGEKFNILSLMANGYIDIDASPAVKPYLMGGIGMANITMEDNWGDEDDNVFAYQVGLGIGFALNNKMTLDLGYRYMGTSDPDFNGVKATYASHNVLAGLRFAF